MNEEVQGDSLAQSRLVHLRTALVRTDEEQSEMAFLEDYLRWVNGRGIENFAAVREKERAERSSTFNQSEPAPAGWNVADTDMREKK